MSSDKMEETLDDILGLWEQTVLERREYWVRTRGESLACFGIYINKDERDIPACMEEPLDESEEGWDCCEECIAMTKKYNPGMWEDE